MLVGIIAESLLGSMLAGKGVIRVNEGTNRAGQKF